MRTQSKNWNTITVTLGIQRTITLYIGRPPKGGGRAAVSTSSDRKYA